MLAMGRRAAISLQACSTLNSDESLLNEKERPATLQDNFTARG
jgi:hypothetical protein